MINNFLVNLKCNKNLYDYLNKNEVISLIESFNNLILDRNYEINLSIEKVNSLINGKSLNYILVIVNGLNEEEKVYFIGKIIKDFSFIKESKLFCLINKLSDDNLIKIGLLLHDKKVISDVFSLIKDKNKKINYLSKLNEKDTLLFLLTLSDEEKLVFIEKGFFVSSLVSSLSEKYIYKEFDKLNDVQKQNVIYNVKNESIKYNLLEKSKGLINPYTEKTLISLIYISTTDLSLKERISNKYFDFKDTEYDITNTAGGKKQILESINILMHKISLLKNYTFGLELETSNENAAYYLDRKYIFNNWFFQDEASVDFGLEITSPVLNYSENALKEIKYICQMTEKIGAKITPTCGGHIHIGFNAFRNENELKMLYMFFCNNENIFYLISNRKNSLIRPKCFNVARPLSLDLNEAISSGKFKNTVDLFDFVRIMNGVQGDRFASINLQNAFTKNKNTIEFRALNCEINYDELVLNIILYLKLVDASIRYSNIKKIKGEFDFLVSNIPNDKEKCDVLLNLLFDKDTYLISKFQERFEENYLINKKVGRIIKKSETIKF